MDEKISRQQKNKRLFFFQRPYYTQLAKAGV